MSSRGGTRTPDPVINSHLLYHLSYSGRVPKARRAAEVSQARRRRARNARQGTCSSHSDRDGARTTAPIGLTLDVHS
jgi:hypothetical protein